MLVHMTNEHLVHQQVQLSVIGPEQIHDRVA